MKLTVAKAIRLRNGHTQKQVADTLGISQPYLSRIESGKVSRDSLSCGVAELMEAYYGKPAQELVQMITNEARFDEIARRQRRSSMSGDKISCGTQMEQLMTMREALSFLRIGRSTFNKTLRDGKGPRTLASPGGGKLLFRRQDLLDWIDKQEYTPVPKKID